MPSKCVSVADNNAQTFSLTDTEAEKVTYSQPQLNGHYTLYSQFVSLCTNYYTTVSTVAVITLIPRSVFSAYGERPTRPGCSVHRNTDKVKGKKELKKR